MNFVKNPLFTQLVGYVIGSNTAISATDTIKTALQNLQAQVTNLLSIAEKQENRDVSNGYPSLSGLALKLKNAEGTVTNTLTNSATAARTYTLQDKSYTLAGTDDIDSIYTRPIENYNFFSPPNTRIFDSINTNIFCGRSKRLKCLINGVESVGLADNFCDLNYNKANLGLYRDFGAASLVLTIDVKTNILDDSYGGVLSLVYCDGFVLLCFYSTGLPLSVTARTFHGQGYGWITAPVSKYSASIIKVIIPFPVYLELLEFTITTKSTNDGTAILGNISWCLTQIEYHGSRISAGQSGAISSAGGKMGGDFAFIAGGKLITRGVYASNAAAISAGLVAGELYNLSDGTVKVVV